MAQGVFTLGADSIYNMAHIWSPPPAGLFNRGVSMRLLHSTDPAKETLRFVTTASLISLLLAGIASAATSAEQVIYRFRGGTDGKYPYASLTADPAGNLYGTTNNGGGTSCTDGCGTVFELSPPAVSGGAWTETVLYRFQGGSDGANPQTPLVFDFAGNLYGTASQGGNGNCTVIQLTGCGTVFELSPAAQKESGWTYHRIYSFQGVPSGQGKGDGAWPAGLAFGKDGNLYGFAYSGGYCQTGDDGQVSCGGAAFLLKNSAGAWSESVIFRFPGPYYPFAGPDFDQAGNIYGAGPGGVYGYGAIFRLQAPESGKGWTQAGVYNFHGTTGDGAFPNFGLVFDVSGNIYASTLGTPTGSYGNVIEVSPAQSGEWAETVLFNFNPLSAGYTPLWGPTLGKNGNLYGTTQEGGQTDFGIAYQLAPPTGSGAWVETVLYNFSFSSASDGYAPSIGLTFGESGALYGATTSGGDASCGVNGDGCGVGFRMAP
jgi:uncharacterized repeat protein (TIGR03803 family)